MKFLDNKIFFGIVEDNKDPNRKGRIKVRVQSVFDNIPLEDIPYASPTSSIDGKSFNVPAIGKVVSVAFAWGDQYQPYYISSNYFNVNLQNKLNSLSEEEYPGFSAMVFDDQTQMYIDSTTFTLDFLFNKLTMTNSNINLELKDNKGKVMIGTTKADQPALMSIHWFDWFDKLVDELIKPSSLIDGSGSVILKPNVDAILTEYKLIRDTFLSKNVYVVDNNKVSKLKRKPKTDTTTNDPNIKANNKDIKYVDDDQIPNSLNNNITDEKQKERERISKSTPQNELFGIDIPLGNVVVVFETSGGSPPESQITLSTISDDVKDKIVSDNASNYEEDPDTQNPDDALTTGNDIVGTEYVEGDELESNTDRAFSSDGVEYNKDEVIDENGVAYVKPVEQAKADATYVAPKTNQITTELFKKTAYGTYFIEPLYGLAGKNLVQFMKDLEKELKGKKLILGLASNGITRSIELTLKGGTNRSSTSKHGVGLAIDMLIDTIELNKFAKVPETSSGLKGGYKKIEYLAANQFLNKDPNLRRYIDAFVKAYPGNLGKKFTIRWGGNFRGVSEFHHFEISDQSMSQFFEPYKNVLKTAGVDVPKTQDDLAKIYNLA